MLLFNDIYDSICFEEVFNLFLLTGFIGYVLMIGSEFVNTFLFYFYN